MYRVYGNKTRRFHNVFLFAFLLCWTGAAESDGMTVSVAGSGSVYMDRAVYTVEISQTSASFLRKAEKNSPLS